MGNICLFSKRREMINGSQILFNFIRLKEDCTELNSKLTKGSVWIFILEQENNYIINLDGMYYGPLKINCERI